MLFHNGKRTFFSLRFHGIFHTRALALYLIYIGFDGSFTGFSEKLFLKDENKFIDIPLYMIVFYVILAYFFGHFLSFFSTLTVEKYTRIFYGDPSKNLLSINQKVRKQDILQNISIKKNFENINLIFIFPLIFFDGLMSLLGYKHKYMKRIDPPYRELVMEKIKTVFNDVGYTGDVFISDENNYHHFLIHYNYEHTKVHGSKLMNYVSLYGFLRVITLISSLYLCSLIIYFIINYSLDLSGKGFKEAFIIFFHIFSYGLLTFIFYLGYLKFYKRYTLENLMLILIVKKD